ncbi:MAG TPA: PQQ-binding-like beta-propeller repeat protein [Planctomycetota bacterium]|nr:PQQ-binding-like beta-propeller repeat protein [Planctomycetota bacterium]
MVPLSDGDRDLWLSRYLDDELSASEKEAVAEKLRTDEKWRAELESLTHSDTTVRAVAIRYHEDDGFTKNIVQKLKPVQKPAPASKPVAHAKNGHRRLSVIRRSNRKVASWPMGLAAVLALSLGGALAFKFLGSSTSSTPEVVAKASNAIQVTEEIRSIAWQDGTTILARKGSIIEKVDDRTLKLDGEAFFHVAKNARPFTVITGDKYKTQALGTRFEVKSTGDAARVRVAEGHVRIEAAVAANKTTVDARGGTEVLPDLKTRQFDSRELAAAWNSREEIAAPWSQLGGSAGHSGITPLSGPASLVKSREAFYAYPEKCEAPASGALISAANRAYVLVRCERDTKLLELKLGEGRGSWRTVAVNVGSPEIQPVITPKGLYVAAQMDGTISAIDLNTGSAAWTYKEKGMIRGLCASPDEKVLVSTHMGMTAIDARDGKTLWRCGEAKDLQAAASIVSSGMICVPSEYGKVYVIDDETGKLINTFNWPRSVVQSPAAIPLVSGNGADEVWLTSHDGYVARMGLDKGATVEKYFGWQLKCSPISTGLLGVGSMVMHFDQPAAVTAPAEDTIVSLVADRRNELFAGYRRGVLHVRARTPGEAMAQLKELDFANVAKDAGDIIKNGLAIAPGKLIATTTRGIQVFE